MATVETARAPRAHRISDAPAAEAGGRASRPAQNAAARRGLILKRTAVVAALLAVTAGLAAACTLFGPQVLAFVGNADNVRAWAAENAPWSQAAFVLANVVQVVFAFIPGEPLELAAGYAFGFWAGTGLCLLASALGTTLVVAAVRRWGIRAVNLFFPTEKIASVSWMRDTRRFELLLFVVFLIPGTPKDLLSYVAGLGTCSLPRIVAITTVGRIPSIVTSTLAAGAFGNGDYTVAVATVAVAIALVAAGAFAYRGISRKGRERQEGAGDAGTPESR